MAETGPDTAAPALTQEQVDQYLFQGYVGPFTLCSPEEMAVIRQKIESEVLTTDPRFETDPRFPVDRQRGRYLDCKVMYDLCSHPAITSRLAGAYGPDLLLFAAALFIKKPKCLPLPFHHDAAYWTMEPRVVCTAWIAVTDATRENGCVQVIPGSHRTPAPHVTFGRSPYSILRRRMGKFVPQGLKVSRKYFDPSAAVHMPLKAGQFFLFSERLLHGSDGNRSNDDRIGVAARITVPICKIRPEAMYPGHRMLVIRGEDRVGHNRLGTPPTE